MLRQKALSHGKALDKFLERFLIEVKQVLEGLINIIVPRLCLCCNEPIERDYKAEFGLEVCKACRDSLKVVSEPYCTVCHTPFKSRTAMSHQCQRCEMERPYYDMIRAPFLYEGPMKEIVANFKYSKTGRSGVLLGGVLGRFSLCFLSPKEDVVVAPVPLFPGKHRKRGYNQAYLLARGLGKETGLKVYSDLLTRTLRHRPPSTSGRGPRM